MQQNPKNIYDGLAESNYFAGKCPLVLRRIMIYENSAAARETLS
jgi:hypothetical protein